MHSGVITRNWNAEDDPTDVLLMQCVRAKHLQYKFIKTELIFALKIYQNTNIGKSSNNIIILFY